MGKYSGPQGKGASKQRRIEKRLEADARAEVSAERRRQWRYEWELYHGAPDDGIDLTRYPDIDGAYAEVRSQDWLEERLDSLSTMSAENAADDFVRNEEHDKALTRLWEGHTHDMDRKRAEAKEFIDQVIASGPRHMPADQIIAFHYA